MRAGTCTAHVGRAHFVAQISFLHRTFVQQASVVELCNTVAYGSCVGHYTPAGPRADHDQCVDPARVHRLWITYRRKVPPRDLHGRRGRGAVARLYWSGFGVVCLQAGVIFMVVAGWYTGVVHAVLLAATLAFIVYSTRTVVKLRRIGGEYYRWRLGGGSGRPGGSGGGNGTTGARPP